jgi:hypothetical protein|tara:strand:- start:304 stop:894 length:591 start_codon:yes stop_codon:yes gene_type:complete
MFPIFMLKQVASFSLLALLSASCATAVEQPKEEVVSIEVKPYEKTWKLPDGTPAEQYVLSELQKHTKISDRNALATILGNIKSESNFHSNICEGGARVPYGDCHRGGYGLIQWTSINRYNNLGKFCNKYDCDPSSLEGQTRYMINENIFQRYLPMFEGGGQTVSQYMVPAYYWLGWGIKGNREIYAYEYTTKLVLA